MKTRIWPYGTRKTGKVIEVIRWADLMIIVFIEDGPAPEAFACVYRAGTVDATEGEEGTITFKEGGPTGAFWDYSPNKTSAEVKSDEQ